MPLYIVPVPVGNLGDMTLRGIDMLREADFIIAEDTRHSRKLLTHFGIKKKLYSYYKPREAEKVSRLIPLLKRGTGALITDSGTPLISDPGYLLVRGAIESGIDVYSLPGATAFVPALTLSGIDPGRFQFLGFPPKTEGKVRSFLEGLRDGDITMIFYESPRRVIRFINIAGEILGNRKFALIRELSKMHESVIRGTLADAPLKIGDEPMLGEVVVVIEGAREIRGESPPEIRSMTDIYDYFRTRYGMSKNELKKKLILNKKKKK